MQARLCNGPSQLSVNQFLAHKTAAKQKEKTTLRKSSTYATLTDGIGLGRGGEKACLQQIQTKFLK